MTMKLRTTTVFSKHRLAAAIACALTGFASGSAHAVLPASNACVPGTTTGTVDCSLWAKAGSAALPGATVNVWGLTDTSTGTVTQPGGPVLVVNQGDTVNINFTNNLTVDTALHFPGQDMPEDTALVAPNGTRLYTFAATQPGTYLYEAAPNPGKLHQAPMGLYGAIVVRPSPANQAYASSTTAFDEEALLVLSEVDPALTNSGNPANFDLRNYAPKYFFINGKVYPNTDNINVTFGGTADKKVLLRYVNAGIKHHPMAVLGQRQTGIARDGNPFANTSPVVGETIAPGATWDALVTVPATTAAGTQFAVYDSDLKLMNSSQPGFGGMLTFIADGSADAWPKVLGLKLTPSSYDNAPTSVAVSATVKTDPATTNTVSAAEYFLGAPGADGTGCALSAAFTSGIEATSGSIPKTGTAPCGPLPTTAGNQTVFVHGQKTDGTTPSWGPFASVALNVKGNTATADTDGPTTTLVTVTPGSTSGAAGNSVAITANASDIATGNHNIQAGEYFIDPTGTEANGTGTAMAVSSATPAASLSATLTFSGPGLSEGTHTISVHAQDAAPGHNNWGVLASKTFTVDKTGPVVDTVSLPPSAAPNPTNGKIGFNANTQAVRFSATLNDASSNVVAAEGFIDVPPANVTTRGFAFAAADGLFDNQAEPVYANIPLTTITALSNGVHKLYIRGKDALGNWGAINAGGLNLTVDKVLPTFTGLTPSPATVVLGGGVAVTINGATDPVTAVGVPGSGVVGGDYWFDGTTAGPTAPAVIKAFTFPVNATTASIDTTGLAAGIHNLRVRIKDKPGNVSAVRSVTLYVVSAVNDAPATNATATNTASLQAFTSNVLTNDLPTGIAGRTVTNVSAATRTAGPVAGVAPGTLSVTCASTGVCTYTLTPATVPATLPAGYTAATYRQASKRGTYTFTYTETLNGVQSAAATVTITVN